MSQVGYALYMQRGLAGLVSMLSGDEEQLVVRRTISTSLYTIIVTDASLATGVQVVCHGRFNKIILSDMLGIGLQHCSSIVQDNTCFNVVS